MKLLLTDSTSRKRPKNGHQTDKRTEEPTQHNTTKKNIVMSQYKQENV